MVARVEDCFLVKEQGFGGYKLLGGGPWGGRWVVGHQGGGRDGDAAHGSSFYGASRSGDIPLWASHHPSTRGVGFAKAEVHLNVHGATSVPVQPQSQAGSVRLNAIAVPESETSPNDGILTSSFVSSYLMAPQSRAATAALQPGRAISLAPGSLARNPSFESITSGSCSTPSFCAGSPVTVFPSRPSDSGSKDSGNSDRLLGPVGAPYSTVESRVITPQSQPQRSDHYLSTDSLSYGSMEERDAIVNCVDDFWPVGEDPLLAEFRFEPMLDDTAMSFSVGELDSLVSTNHGPAHRTMQVQQPPRCSGSLASVIQATTPAPDFCQSFFAVEGDKATIASSSTNHGSKPSQLAIPAKSSILAAFNANSDNGGRLRWSDQTWSGAGGVSPAPQFIPEKSPTSLAGSSPSSPTTPLDPHLFTQTVSSTLRAEEIQKKLTEFSNTGSTTSNKRSFATMSGEKEETLPRGAGPALNADKFDAAALSALLYNNTQSNPEYRSACNNTASATPPAPKQRRRHGTATDPQSIAARTRREKFTDRIRVLQSLVPNGERLDTVHMLTQTWDYIRFLQHKVWDLYNGKDSIADVKCEKWKEFVDTATGQVIV